LIITSDLGLARGVPARRPGCRLVASIDVEWTKNYKVKNGNVPFCWSVVWLQVQETPDGLVPQEFAFTSAYVTGDGETQELICGADAQIGCMLAHADMIIGHQVSSDLAVLRNVSAQPLPAVDELRARWHARRVAVGGPDVIDSRYDAGGILRGASRRLVDVCTELGMDVTQPELARTSMTALHRRWLDAGDPSARERITVLNLRHSLSAGYVALRSTGLAGWGAHLNVNRVLDRQLGGTFAWLATPVFRELL
jgi:hypothetical protein